MTDHPTIDEQIDAVEWAEANASQLARLAEPHRGIGLLDHRKALTREQITALHARLTAAAETLRTIDFMRETLK